MIRNIEVEGSVLCRLEKHKSTLTSICLSQDCQGFRLLCSRCLIEHNRQHKLIYFNEFLENPILLLSAFLPTVSKAFPILNGKSPRSLYTQFETLIDQTFDEYSRGVQSHVEQLRIFAKSNIDELIKERTAFLNAFETRFEPEAMKALFKSELSNGLREFEKILSYKLQPNNLPEDIEEFVRPLCSVLEELNALTDQRNFQRVSDAISNVLMPNIAATTPNSAIERKGFFRKEIEFPAKTNPIKIWSPSTQAVLTTARIESKRFEVKLFVLLDPSKALVRQIGLVNKKVLEQAESLPWDAEGVCFETNAQGKAAFRHFSKNFNSNIGRLIDNARDSVLTFEGHGEDNVRIYFNGVLLCDQHMSRDFPFHVYIMTNDPQLEVTIISSSIHSVDTD